MFEQRSSSDAVAALSIKTKTTRDNKRYTRDSGSDVNNCSPAPTSRFLSLSHSLSHGDSGKRQLLRRRASLAGNTMTVTTTATATAATTTTLTTQANKKNTQRMINFQLQFSHVSCHISEAPNSSLGPPTGP